MEIKNVKVVHFMPGRVRLRVEDLKGMPELVRKVQSALGAVPGVERVEVKTLTGSIVIEYNAQSIRSTESREALSKVLTTFFPTLDVPKLLAWLATSRR